MILKYTLENKSEINLKKILLKSQMCVLINITFDRGKDKSWSYFLISAVL